MSVCPDCIACPTCKGSGDRHRLGTTSTSHYWAIACDDCSGSGIYVQCDSCAPELEEQDVFITIKDKFDPEDPRDIAAADFLWATSAPEPDEEDVFGDGPHCL